MIVLVTGNPDKLKELQQVFPASLALDSRQLDLDEIQSLDLHAIVQHKLRQAYAILQQPVIVEDVAAELEMLKGLPGPFIKFFQQRLGGDALYRLGGEGATARIVCTMGYYDGHHEIIVDGVVQGTVTAPRGRGGFGFDICVVPDGYDLTFAEMPERTKNKLSHRYRAAVQMADRLETLLQ